jgi:hypothetical protein
MTSYSVLRSAQRATVIATWPGAWSDHSANITTLADSEQAAYLASAPPGSRKTPGTPPRSSTPRLHWSLASAH